MGAHLINGTFQSDKYPSCPAGKVPLSVKDPTAQDLLWEYAQRRRAVDAEFSDDLEYALVLAGYHPPTRALEDRHVTLAEYHENPGRILAMARAGHRVYVDGGDEGKMVFSPCVDM